MGGNAKNRKPQKASESAGNDEVKEAPKVNKPVETPRPKFPINPNHKKAAPKDNTKIFFVVVVLFIVPVAISWVYNNHLSNLVNKPLNEPTVINPDQYRSPENLDRFWGTYRPNLYFGLKTRSNDPLNVGMIWWNQMSPKFQMRHACDQGDGLVKYGWIAHDGRNFGIHDIYESAENAFSIRTSWAKRPGGQHGGDWTVRTKVAPFGGDRPAFVSTIFYISADNAGWIRSLSGKKSSVSLNGKTEELGNFKVSVELTSSENKQVFLDFTHGNASLYLIKDELIQNGYFRRIKTKKENLKEYVGLNSNVETELSDANFVAIQVSGFLPFEFDLVFQSQSAANQVELKGQEFDSLLSTLNGQFLKKFEEKFELSKKNFSASATFMAQAALSNLLGGIGFFSGQSIVKSMHAKEPVLYWPSHLYTAVPSRSFFPRGFLWDEGFHNILISKWDLEITKDIIGHWLDLMNVEGWIPREVILNDEARSKVPREFWIQNNQFANPPTLFLPLAQVIHRVNENIQATKENDHRQNPDYIYLSRIYKRLVHWYDWFNNTQIGKTQYTYRWRGRIPDSRVELNPKTLTSGLDDYPRASHPNDNERHLDLRCWMALASKVMGDLSDILKQDPNSARSQSNQYTSHYQTLKNNEILDQLHWSGSQYADYGLHTDHARLVRAEPREPNVSPQSMPFIRVLDQDPTYQFVNSVGYVSLFPFLLEIIEPQSEKLGKTLEQIRDRKHLWTTFGLRSLSKSAPLYNVRNTEHDPPYWRGAIWININYLTLRALKHYSSVDGPYKEKAAQIYTELRHAIITNMQANYETNGYIWEQYNDQNGKGKGSHPFTGWSALIVLIMAEVF